MKKVMTLTLFLCALCAFSQAKKTTFDSFKLGSQRTLKLYIPENYSEEKSYPLLVVLDAEYLFDIAVANTKFFAFNGSMPETIVVGIDQTDTVDEDCAFGENGFPEKKSAAFFEFLGQELIPSLQKQYKIANFKAVIGHSLSANFIHYYLFKESPLFDAYVSLSPAMAPRMEQLVPERLAGLQSMKFFYLATGTRDFKEEQERIGVLNSNIKKISNDNLHYYFDNFEKADNYSLGAYGIPKALDQFFAIYKPINKEEYKEKIIAGDVMAIDYLNEKYGTIEKLFGFRKPVSLNDMIAIYSAIKKKEQFASLEALSDIAKKDFPDTMMGFFLEAEFYEQMGEPKKAMRTYEKAFGMPNIDFMTKDLALDRINKLKEDFGW